MKLTAHEEYGLRCLLQIGRQGERGTRTIPEMSRAEGISIHHAGKILQILRQGGFLKSVRGQTGGYTLARPPEQIIIGDVLTVLGGRLYEESFCDDHSGRARACTHTVDCSIRSLWRMVQSAVDEVLSKTTLKDLLRKEEEMTSWLNELVTLPESQFGFADVRAGREHRNQAE
jgi:Rrf2 family protein